MLAGIGTPLRAVGRVQLQSRVHAAVASRRSGSQATTSSTAANGAPKSRRWLKAAALAGAGVATATLYVKK